MSRYIGHNLSTNLSQSAVDVARLHRGGIKTLGCVHALTRQSNAYPSAFFPHDYAVAMTTTRTIHAHLHTDLEHFKAVEFEANREEVNPEYLDEVIGASAVGYVSFLLLIEPILEDGVYEYVLASERGKSWTAALITGSKFTVSHPDLPNGGWTWTALPEQASSLQGEYEAFNPDGPAFAECTVAERRWAATHDG
jgi:hypothetical protein